MTLNIAIVGAGSREFGPAVVADLLLSDAISDRGLGLALMDLDPVGLEATGAFATTCAETLQRPLDLRTTTDLGEALSGADHVILAIERRRYFYWSQDFHVPRRLGFRQIYGENGGPGGLFHALRNLGPCMEVARAMERICPEAWLLNFTNPLTKLTQVLVDQTRIPVVGFCHGVFAGMRQVAALLDRPVDELRFEAGGLNHFTWFTAIRDRATDEDLYPRLRSRERESHWLARWDDMALPRILFRVFGLYPSPGSNHIGEYLGWAGDHLASQHLQFHYDPRAVDPWSEDRIPPWIYSLEEHPTGVPLSHPIREGRLRASDRSGADPLNPKPSGELAIPFIEGMSCGQEHRLEALNVANRGYLPGVPEGTVVEVPATVKGGLLLPQAVPALPEGATALLRTQVSINALLEKAFMERSRGRLLQALLLEPTTPSYPQAVHLINEMYELQKDALPPLTWAD